MELFIPTQSFLISKINFVEFLVVNVLEKLSFAGLHTVNFWIIIRPNNTFLYKESSSTLWPNSTKRRSVPSFILLKYFRQTRPFILKSWAIGLGQWGRDDCKQRVSISTHYRCTSPTNASGGSVVSYAGSHARGWEVDAYRWNVGVTILKESRAATSAISFHTLMEYRGLQCSKSRHLSGAILWTTFWWRFKRLTKYQRK